MNWKPKNLFDKGRLAISLWLHKAWWTFGKTESEMATVYDFYFLQIVWRKR